MFLIPIIAVLLTFTYARPHELWEVMRPLNVNLVALLVLFGFVVDTRIRAIRLRGSLLLAVMLGLFGWYMLTVAVKAPDRLGEQIGRFGIGLIGFLSVSQAFQSLRGLGVAAAMLLAFTLTLAGVASEQGLNPKVCHLVAAENDQGELDVADGRTCERRGDCLDGGIPDREYMCERPGLFGTHSIGGRVRFRGLLEDPNELAWAIAMGTPLAFALWERRRTALRLILLVATLVVGFATVIMTQSRSGQISMMAMLAVYFVRRFGVRGAIAGVLVSLPLLLLGGRSGEEAESSSTERLECWSEALSMWRENPFLGVGGGQFLEHHYLTAHSSFMLTLAELGPIGYLLWCAVLYVAFKIVIRIQIDMGQRPEAVAVRTWATAILASLVGMLLSVFFLTLAYHPILWIFLALPAALYAAVREHDPSYRVPFGWRDVVAVATIAFSLIAFIAVYLKLNGL